MTLAQHETITFQSISAVISIENAIDATSSKYHLIFSQCSSFVS